MQATTGTGLDPDLRDKALHDARKVVKRARYSVEPLQPVYGGSATKLIQCLKALQVSLGQLQDTVITREYLHHLVVSHPQELEATVGLVAGAIIEREAVHGAEYEQAARVAWRQLMDTMPLR
jgi:CHAD domain-containing protein